MTPATTPRRAWPLARVAFIFLWAAGAGAALGAVAAVASESLAIVGLYETAVGLAGGFALILAAQLLDLRAATLHVALAATLATTALASQFTVDAWLTRQSLIRDVAAHGLLLADDAILRGDNDPGALVDDSLRVDTGIGGVRGAARLRLASGLAVLRIAGQVHALRMPVWLHALCRGALAAWMAALCARALANWRAESRCPHCHGPLARTVLAAVTEPDIALIVARWRANQPTLPRVELVREATAAALVYQERCPRCACIVGWELRRTRGRGLAALTPGPIATIAALDVADRAEHRAS